MFLISVWMVYTVGLVFVAGMLWVFDHENQRWKENIVWALTWPIWVVFWIVAVLISIFSLWL